MANETESDLRALWDEMVQAVGRQIVQEGRDPNVAFRSNFDTRKIGFLMHGSHETGEYFMLEVQDGILHQRGFDGLARVFISEWKLEIANESPKP